MPDIVTPQVPISSARVTVPGVPRRVTVQPLKASERLRRLSEVPLYIKMLLHGDPGAGKTYLACTAPNPLLILSEWVMSRLTLERLRKDRGIDPDVICVSSEEEVIDAIKYAHEHAGKYETFVIDGVTDINEMILRNILEDASAGRIADLDHVSERNWDRLLRRTSNIIQMCRALPGHTVITALTTSDRPGALLPFVYPKGLRHRLAAQFNFVGYLVAEGRPNKPALRKLYTEVGPGYQAKSPGGFVPPVVENPDLGQIFSQIMSMQATELSAEGRGGE